MISLRMMEWLLGFFTSRADLVSQLWLGNVISTIWSWPPLAFHFLSKQNLIPQPALVTVLVIVYVWVGYLVFRQRETQWGTPSFIERLAGSVLWGVIVVYGALLSLVMTLGIFFYSIWASVIVLVGSVALVVLIFFDLPLVLVRAF